MTNNENLYAKGKKILASGMTMGEKTEEKNPEVDKFEDASKAAEKAVKEAEKAEKANEMSYEATRNLVIAAHKNTGIYIDGFYTDFYELSKSGRSYKMQHEDKFIYVACSACVTDGNGWLFVPFTAVESAVRFNERNGINEYVGG